MRKAMASIAPMLARLDTVERRQITDQQRNEERFDTIFKAMDGGDFSPQKVFFGGKHYDAFSFARKLVRKATKSIVLVDELVDYVRKSNDHPIIKAAVVHYQIATIHPFEDGNGRTARLMFDFVLDASGYGFGGIGSLEEYFAYDADEYYRSLQMGLPALYYDGRNEPPHPEIWLSYFTRMMELHAAGALEIAEASDQERRSVALSHLSAKERAFLAHLEAENIRRFGPSELAKALGVTNRTVINWCAGLMRAGFLRPETGGKRIRFYVRTEP